LRKGLVNLTLVSTSARVERPLRIWLNISCTFLAAPGRRRSASKETKNLKRKTQNIMQNIRTKNLERKTQNQDSKFKILIFKFWFLAFSFTLFVFSVAVCVFAEQPPVSQKSCEVIPTEVAIERICSAIYKGDFAAAREVLGKRYKFESTAISRLADLADIVSEYEAIEQQREKAREQAYAEQLTKLERFRADADVNDVNDANNITSVLSVIAGACEFADERQRDKLLSEAFVKQTIQRAKARSAEYESKGKWLNAYTSCYWWLAEQIEPVNKEYSDYAEQLIEKANIVASFQDSPCESSEERFRGVKKELFVWAIGVLNSNYVGIVDYRQMATKAIKRCELLAEVMEKITDSNDVGWAGLKVKSKKLKVKTESWSAALAALLDEMKTPAGMSKDEFIDVFEKVLILNAATVELPGEVLIAQFVEAAFSGLDPYTVMIWPRQVQDFEKEMTNEFTGIGVEISKRKGLLTISSLLLDTPAYNCGLDAGDVIEAVDGVETRDMSIMCAVRRITGPAGSKVRLTVRGPGQDESRNVTITRARITVPTIRGWQRTGTGKWLYMIDDANKIGYVRITGFSERTAADLEKVLVGLEREGLSGLILDLRFNFGGLLDSAAKVTDKFIKSGLIVITRPRSWVSSTYLLAHKAKTHPDYPLVVLINSRSASASEIVAGALADEQHSRAILVGERSHGKGSVQGITHYPGGDAQLKYTMAYYHLPSGKRVESQDAMKRRGRKDWGVRPNVEIKLRSDELKKMIDVQRDNDVLVKVGHDNGSVPLKKHTAEEILASDPQLAVGVLVVKAKLIEKAESKKQMSFLNFDI